MPAMPQGQATVLMLLQQVIYVCLGHQNFTSPVTPAELLIALHGVDPTKVDVKTIIKGMRCTHAF